MFGSGILEVAIGLAFVYLLLSLICTAISEWIASVFKLRAKNLEAGIRSLFSDGKLSGGKDIADALYDHGLIKSMYRLDKDGTRQLPSYIPSRTFALALFEILSPSDEKGTKQLPEILKGVKDNLGDGPARQALFAVINQADGDLEKARKSVEDWYNGGMDRVSGWYKRKTQFILLALGILIAVGTNTDSVLVAKTLWNTPALRESTAKAAEQFVKTNKEAGASSPDKKDGSGGTDTNTNAPVSPQKAAENVRLFNGELRELGLPIGWPTIPVKADGTPIPPNPNDPPDPRSFPSKVCSRLFWGRILGWFLTAIAISFGAPFWFDTLNKFMVVRSTVKPQEKSQPEASKDSQGSKDAKENK